MLIQTTDVNLERLFMSYGFGWAVGESEDPVGTYGGRVWSDSSGATEYAKDSPFSDHIAFPLLYKRGPANPQIIKLTSEEAAKLESYFAALESARTVIAGLHNAGELDALEWMAV